VNVFSYGRNTLRFVYIDINEITIYEGLKIFCTLTIYSTKYTLQAIFVSIEL